MSKLEWVLMENSVFAPLSAITISEANYYSLLTDGQNLLVLIFILLWEFPVSDKFSQSYLVG